MADLLECLVQIRALRETPRRLAALVAAADPSGWTRRAERGGWAPVEVLAHLADAELLAGVRLRLVLTTDRPPLPAWDRERLAERAGYLATPVGVALDRFTSRRAETLELLAGCDAAELERVGLHPERGPVTVADLVALMLAHDTDHAAQIRAGLGVDPGEGGH